MRSPTLNTLLVQRIETTLGVPLAQHTQIRAGARGTPLSPPLAASAVTVIDTATAKQAFLQTLAARAGATRPTGGDSVFTSHAAEVSTQPTSAASLAQATGGPPSGHMHLSAVGKILASLFDQFPTGAGPLTSTQPLFISAALALRAQGPAVTQRANPQQGNAPSSALTRSLMSVLKAQIAQSGLFYESHLLRQLQRHPTQLIDPPDEPQRYQPIVSDESMDIDASLRTLVRQQLDVLAGQPIQWQGTIWPGAHMHWELVPPVYPENRDDQAVAEEIEESTFVSRLTLDLPSLGQIHVRIKIQGVHVDIGLDVQDSGTLIKDQLEGLKQLITDLGLTPTSITARHQDEVHD